jgi:threonine/homoserine/homoserine lactone efflux protein
VVPVSIAFLVTTLVVVATPGTGVIYTLSAGLSRGRRAGVLAALSCTLAIVPHVLAAVTGLAALLHASAVAFQAVKYLGVAYLAYTAWATLRDRHPIVVDQPAVPRSPARTLVSGVLVNTLNPKLSVFFLAFLPQFVSTGAPGALPRMLALSGVFMLASFVVFTGYGVGAAAVRRHVVGRPAVLAWLRRAFAGTFLALGLRLAVVAR